MPKNRQNDGPYENGGLLKTAGGLETETRF